MAHKTPTKVERLGAACERAVAHAQARLRTIGAHGAAERLHKAGAEGHASAARNVLESPESAGEAWLRAGLEAIERGCKRLTPTYAEGTEIDAALRALAIYCAHADDGHVTILARGTGLGPRIRVYTDGPKGFERWLNAMPADEQWLVGGDQPLLKLAEGTRR